MTDVPDVAYEADIGGVLAQKMANEGHDGHAQTTAPLRVRRPRSRLAVHRVALVLATSFAGCAPTLVPAEDVRVVEAPGRAAAAACAGVRITASAGPWRGFPPGLPRLMTPMLVAVENDGGRPIEIRYDHFALVGARTFAALPPFWTIGQVEPVTPVYPSSGFAVAPWLAASFPARPVFTDDFPFHTDYYDRHFTEIARIYRPSRDMRRKALPEGVLAPGGRIVGFVYFERVEGMGRILFVARLVAAGEGRHSALSRSRSTAAEPTSRRYVCAGLVLVAAITLPGATCVRLPDPSLIGCPASSWLLITPALCPSSARWFET
ncbi:hypothetical protein [Nannocystis pusilla]|uniref:Uncharacterized protein n=1 Tax=Nannocystis pusilla TaxID=889268 RepID=A0ABS7U5N1_9BACT|nr:hypothetical protein [Nannocystis pusilla]MBZ5715719.1 hypothetical protein [Nannocystis pusilla]